MSRYDVQVELHQVVISDKVMVFAVYIIEMKGLKMNEQESSDKNLQACPYEKKAVELSFYLS